MRYLHKILIGAILMLAMHALCGCSGEPTVPGPEPGQIVSPEGEEFLLKCSMVLPDEGSVTTRTLRNTPELAGLHLYLVEFTGGGGPLANTLIRVYEADNETVTGDQIYFSVMLRSTTLPRVLHLIALPEGQELSVETGIEAAVIPALVAQGGTDAYWRRLEFPAGYCVESAGEWVVDPELRTRLTRVPLIRNYAKFTISNEDPSFKLLGFRLVNTPTQGSIAAWNPATRKFIDFLDNSGNTLSYTQISALYNGLYPADTGLDNQILPPEGSPIPDNASEPQFMYERPFSEDARTYVIVKGERNGQVFYYKLDIGRNDDDGIFRYINILRNFNYKLVIKKVASDGYTSVGQAASGTVFNNISFDIELQKLTNMSDGAEIVYVDFTTEVITSTTPQTITFRYRYKDIASGNFNNAGTKIVDLRPGPVIESITSQSTTDNANGYRTVKFVCKPAVAETQIQKFIVIKPSTGLGRTVTLISHLKWPIEEIRVYPKNIKTYDSTTANENCLPLSVASSSGTVSTIGNAFTLFFDLPGDLPEVVFPLEFVLESKQQIMENQPGTGNMAVESGESLFDATKTAIQYKRVVTWTDYSVGDTDGGMLVENGLHRVVCHFRTTKPLTNGTSYSFIISNKNFNDATIAIKKAVVL